MKRAFLFLIALLFLSCSKEPINGPEDMKKGQEAIVSLSHQYGGTEDFPILLPKKIKLSSDIVNFRDREPGYNYEIKVKKVKLNHHVADGPSEWLEFVKVLKKEKYAGVDPFDIELVTYSMWGPVIQLNLINNEYMYRWNRVSLTSDTPEINNQLKEISDYVEALKNGSAEYGMKLK